MIDGHRRKRSDSLRPKPHDLSNTKTANRPLHRCIPPGSREKPSSNRPEVTGAIARGCSKDTHSRSKSAAHSSRSRSRPLSDTASGRSEKVRAPPLEPTSPKKKRLGTHPDDPKLPSSSEKRGHHDRKLDDTGVKLPSAPRTLGRKRDDPPGDLASSPGRRHGKKDVPAEPTSSRTKHGETVTTRSEPLPSGDEPKHRPNPANTRSVDAKSLSRKGRSFAPREAKTTPNEAVARSEKVLTLNGGGKKKATPSEAVARFEKVDREVDANILSLNGALPGTSTRLDMASLVHRDHEQRTYANLRFPAKLVDAVYSLQKIVVSNNLPLEEWFTVPIKQLGSTSYKWMNAEGTLKKTSLAHVLNVILGPKPRCTWDVSVLHVPAEIHVCGANGSDDFLRSILKQFSRERVSESCSLRDMPRSIRDVIFLVLQTIALLGTTLVHETLREYLERKAFAPQDRTKSDLHSKSTSNNTKAASSPRKEEKPQPQRQPSADAVSGTRALTDLHSKATPSNTKSTSIPRKADKPQPQRQPSADAVSGTRGLTDLHSKATPSNTKAASSPRKEEKPQPLADAVSVSTAKSKGSKGKGKGKVRSKRKNKESNVENSGTLPESNSDDSLILRLLKMTTYTEDVEDVEYSDDEGDNLEQSANRKDDSSDSCSSGGDTSVSSWLTANFQTTVCVPKSDSESEDDGTATRIIATPEDMDLRVTSSSYLFNDIRVITTDTRGHPLNLAPWGVQITIGTDDKTAKVLLWTSNQLGAPKSEALIGWELWYDVPEGNMVKVTFVPEEGSPAFAVGENVSKYIYKPSMEIIDFTDATTRLFGKTEFVFAKTLGKGHPMCFMYRPPLVVVAPRSKVICIRNKTKDKKWITPRFKLDDLHRFLLETCPAKWNGYGGLHFFRGGTLDPKSHTVIDEVYFDDEPMEFVIELLDRREKEPQGAPNPEEAPVSEGSSPGSEDSSQGSEGSSQYYSESD